MSKISRVIVSPRLKYLLLDMAKDQINRVSTQAEKAFTADKKSFERKLNKLTAVMNKTTAADLNLDAEFMSPDFWRKPDKAPVTYVEVFENNLLSMGVFVLRQGMKLPLHDHPEMYGLIKVLMGKVKITSFTVNEDPEAIDIEAPDQLTAAKHPDVTVGTESEVCILEPKNRNIHELQSIDGPAAFFDILSPPYDTPVKSQRKRIRKCNYYTITKQSGDTCKLKEIEPPTWFWNDRNPYKGPTVLLGKKSDSSLLRRFINYFRKAYLRRNALGESSAA